MMIIVVITEQITKKKNQHGQIQMPFQVVKYGMTQEQGYTGQDQNLQLKPILLQFQPVIFTQQHQGVLTVEQMQIVEMQ